MEFLFMDFLGEVEISCGQKCEKLPEYGRKLPFPEDGPDASPHSASTWLGSVERTTRNRLEASSMSPAGGRGSEKTRGSLAHGVEVWGAEKGWPGKSRRFCDSWFWDSGLGPKLKGLGPRMEGLGPRMEGSEVGFWVDLLAPWSRAIDLGV